MDISGHLDTGAVPKLQKELKNSSEAILHPAFDDRTDRTHQ